MKLFVRYMSDEDLSPVEVTLPRALLYEIDEFGTRRGYVTQGAVVSEALKTTAEKECPPIEATEE